MKTIFRFLIILFFISTSGFAQPKGYWRLAYGLRPGNFSPFIVDSTFLYTVDTSGFFSISTDGGDSWSAFSTVPLPKKWAWLPLTPRISFGYQNDSQAFFRSNDGGITWKKLFVIKDSLSGVYNYTMWNLSSGFVIYKDNLGRYHDLVTHDGCASFTDLGHDSLFQIVGNRRTFRMTWLDSLNGILWIPSAGPRYYHTLLVTHSGAIDWRLAHVYTPSGDTAVPLSSYGEGHGDTYSLFDLRPRPYFYYSTDYGDHWQTSDTSNIPTYLRYPTQSSRTALWSGAKQTKNTDVGPNTVLLYTNDLGKNWNVDRLTFKDYGISSITFPDSLHGFVNSETNFFKFIAGSSGVNQNGKTSDASDLEIYPNPCGNIIRLRTSQSIRTVRILNLLGQDVMRSSEPEQSVFDTSRLPDGIYTLECVVIDGIPVRRSFLKITP